MIIPKEFAGLVIGSKGSNKKELETKFNVQITIINVEEVEDEDLKQQLGDKKVAV